MKTKELLILFVCGIIFYVFGAFLAVKTPAIFAGIDFMMIGLTLIGFCTYMCFTHNIESSP